MTSKEVGECIGIFDEDNYLEIIVEAIKEEFINTIPNFDSDNMTSRQKVLLITLTQDLYDNRTMYQDNSKLNISINTMLFKEYNKRTQ